jgi:UDP-galactopyranose mutase
MVILLGLVVFVYFMASAEDSVMESEAGETVTAQQFSAVQNKLESAKTELGKLRKARASSNSGGIDKLAEGALIDAIAKSSAPIGFDAGGLDYKTSLGDFPKEKTWDVCTVGAGISGSVMAERYSKIKGKTTLVMDIRKHIAGNCYDWRDPYTGILMNLYGAHLWHTNSERVWNYINLFKKYAGWRRWDHQVVGWIDDRLLPIPVNIDTVNGLFDETIKTEPEMDKWLAKVQVPCDGECKNAEEMAMSRVGKNLYEKIFKTYTVKQWDKTPDQLDALVTARIPVRNNRDSRYFGDKYQVLPSKGYTQWFVGMLDDPNIDILLGPGANYFELRSQLDTRCGKLIFTGPIDKYFKDAGLEKLEYRSINFEAEVIENDGYFQPNSVVNYPGGDVKFTRIVEYKHYFHQHSSKTVIVREYTTKDGDPYYPVPNPRNHALYKKYQALAAEEEKAKNVHFVGRLASYKYFNMDAAIENTLNMFDKIENNPPMPDIDAKGVAVDRDGTSNTVSDSVD